MKTGFGAEPAFIFPRRESLPGIPWKTMLARDSSRYMESSPLSLRLLKTFINGVVYCWTGILSEGSAYEQLLVACLPESAQ